MAPQHFSSMGVVASISVGLWLGCAGLLGIEDATCDARFDRRCSVVDITTLQPVGNGGSAMSPGGAGGAVTGGTGGATATGGAGGRTMPGEADAAPEGPSLCEEYCDTIAAACPPPNEQYASVEACRSVCGMLDAGSPGESQNTVQCRLARAKLARNTGEPAAYCFSAGPGGSGACGSNCEGYCTIMAKACTLLVSSFEACLPECALVPDVSLPPDNVTYNVSVQAGDSVQCRLFHVSAATVDPIMHCGHASGSTPCAPSLDDDEGL